MAVEIISWPNLHEKMCRTRRSIAVPFDSQATSLPTDLGFCMLTLKMEVFSRLLNTGYIHGVEIYRAIDLHVTVSILCTF